MCYTISKSRLNALTKLRFHRDKVIDIYLISNEFARNKIQLEED